MGSAGPDRRQTVGTSTGVDSATWLTLSVTGMTCASCESGFPPGPCGRVPASAVAVPSPRPGNRTVCGGRAPLDRDLLEPTPVRSAATSRSPPWLIRDRSVWRTVVRHRGGDGRVVILPWSVRPRPTYVDAFDPGRGALLFVLVLGLTAGVSTCMAMVGGWCSVLGLAPPRRLPPAVIPRRRSQPGCGRSSPERRSRHRFRLWVPSSRPRLDDEPATRVPGAWCWSSPRHVPARHPADRVSPRWPRRRPGCRPARPAARPRDRRTAGTARWRTALVGAPPPSSCPAGSPRPCRSTRCRPRRRWPRAPSWPPSPSARPRAARPGVGAGGHHRPAPGHRAARRRGHGAGVRAARRVERPEPARAVGWLGQRGVRARHPRTSPSSAACRPCG